MDEELTELAHAIRDELARRYTDAEILSVTIDEHLPIDDGDVVGVDVVYRQRDPDGELPLFMGAVRSIRPLMREVYDGVFPYMRFYTEEDMAELAEAD